MIKVAYFESTERKYTLILSMDLLKDISVRRTWGGKFNNLHGQALPEYFKTLEKANEYFEAQVKRRKRRGYEITYLVDDIANPRSQDKVPDFEPFFDPCKVEDDTENG